MYDLCIADARALPFDDGCAHTCVTSPPYFGLRDYGHAGQIGLEGNIQDFVNELVGVFREVRRVLRDDGTLWLNLGDSYAGAGLGGGTQNQGIHAYPKGNTVQARTGARRVGNLKPKDLMGVPWHVAFALQADGWFLRSDIIWHKPNPMPESIKDRPTKAHEYLFLFAKSERYFYDADAVKEQIRSTAPSGNSSTGRQGGGSRMGVLSGGEGTSKRWQPTGKKNKRSVWTVTTKPYKGAHFATYPPELIEPCILAGSPEGGTVLDPFTGSGTTGAVAIKHGRRFIGTELNPDYGELARERMTRALEASGRATVKNTAPGDRVQLGLNLGGVG